MSASLIKFSKVQKKFRYWGPIQFVYLEGGAIFMRGPKRKVVSVRPCGFAFNILVFELTVKARE